MTGLFPHTYERDPVNTRADGSYQCTCGEPLIHRAHPHESIATRTGGTHCVCGMPIGWPGHYRKD